MLVVNCSSLIIVTTLYRTIIAVFLYAGLTVGWYQNIMSTPVKTDGPGDLADKMAEMTVRSGPEPLGLGRNNMKRQGILRNMREEPLEIAPDQFRNTLEYEAYDDFLKTDKIYAPFRLCDVSYARASLYAETRKFAVLDVELDAMDLDTMRSRLTYLSDVQAKLLNRGDFRLVTRGKFRPANTQQPIIDPDRSIACALAGIIGMTLGQMFHNLAPDGITAPNGLPYSTEQQLLEACERGGIIEFSSSDKLSGVRGVNNYLRDNADELLRPGCNANLILSQFGDGRGRFALPAAENGHAVVLKYSVDKSRLYEPDPQKVLIDFQMPGLMRIYRYAGPNPLRFSTHVDPSYTTFKLHTVYLP